MPTYARRTASQADHETAQAARKAATRQHRTDDPAALRATASPQAAVQARLAALAQGSGRAAQLRALQASADARPLPAGMAAVQRFDGGEEEELPVQGRFADTAQRNGVEEEEPLQGRFTDTAQRSAPEEEELVQGRFGAAPVQRQAADEDEPAQMAKAPALPNRTGLPNQLKAGIEALSGLSMDKVRVHYNSAKPAQLNALAYAQGTDIHMGPGQEQHLPHEAWHVVQQAQGRVRPTLQLQGTAVNDDAGLENEADVMGARAMLSGTEQSDTLGNMSGSHSVRQLHAKKVVHETARHHFKDGWGASYGITTDQQLKDSVPDAVTGKGEVDLDWWDAPDNEQEYSDRTKQKRCSIAYKDDNRRPNTTWIYHCGPSKPAYYYRKRAVPKRS